MEERVLPRGICAVCDCFHCGLCVLCVCGLLPVFEVGPTEAGGAWDEVEVMFEFS